MNPVSLGLTALQAAPAVMSLFGLGGGGKQEQTSLLSPEQQQLQQMMMSGLMSGEGPFSFLSNQGTTDQFQKLIADPQMQYFQNRMVPAIQQGFIGNNLGRSSLNQDSLIRAGSQVQSNLDKMLFDAIQGNQRMAVGAAQGLINPGFQATPQPQPGGFDSFMGAFGPQSGQAVSDLFGMFGNAFGGQQQPQGGMQANRQGFK